MTPNLLAVLTLVLAGLAAAGGLFAAFRSARPSAGDDGERLIEAMRKQMAELRGELDQKAATQRMELTDALTKMGGGLDARVATLSENLNRHFTAFAEVQQQSGKNLADSQRERLGETNAAVLQLKDALTAQQAEGRKAMADEMEKLRKENEAKLEQMRLTVDEKLQSTLDQRLDASFKQVSDRLESVQKGLGEMQSLATGVGDLKRVLTNVRARGAWGEVQLESLLEDTLTADQYQAQVQIRPRSPERVDFAVRLPGQDEKGQVWLPIDCKFPHEDYARLINAQDAADPDEVQAAGKALERALAVQAKSMAEKYIHPPHSTDFAYLYLPTEGLFAEVVRREGFTAELRTKYRVEVAGPSTLTALLNSLRVGFRSLQIQKKSSEVWTELGKVKTAFEKYGDALEAVDTHLDKAKGKVMEVSKRHKAVVHSLRNVESVEIAAPSPAALLPGLEGGDAVDGTGTN